MAPTSRGKRAGNPGVVVITPGGSEAETEEKSEQETAAEAVIEETTSANPRTPEAIVYKLDPDSGEERWVCKVASSLISNEWLAKRYGGGKYRVQHRKPNGTGKMVYAQQETYTIDASVRPEAMSAPVMNGDGTPAGGGGSRIDAIMEAGVMSLIQQMQNANTTQMELVRSIVAERSGPKGPNFTEILTALSPIIAAIVPALTNRPDVMTQAREIAELAAKNNGAQGGLKDFIGAFKEMMEVKELLGGGGGGDDRPTGERLLEAAIPKFMEIADRYAQNAPPAPVVQAPGAVVQPRPMQATLPAGASPQPQEGPVVWTVFVNRRVPHWVMLAQRDKNPSLYAELEIDNMPPMFMGQLREFLMRDDAVDLVLGMYPQLAQYEHWAREFFEEITKLVLGEDDEEEFDGGEDDEQIEASGSGDGGTERVAVEDDRSADERGPVGTGEKPRRRRTQSREGTGGGDGSDKAPTS
jgi:hypothetical protein